jgi:hypothetical protein
VTFKQLFFVKETLMKYKESKKLTEIKIERKVMEAIK